MLIAMILKKYAAQNIKRGYHIVWQPLFIVKRIFAIRIACKQALATCPITNQPHCRFAAVWQKPNLLPD